MKKTLDARIRAGANHYLPFDVASWQGSHRVQQMDAATYGCYFAMLIVQWDKGSAPPTPEACFQEIGFTLEVWQQSWSQLRPCFIERKKDGRLINERMDSDKKDRIRFLKLQQERGRIGGTHTQQRIKASRVAKASVKRH